MQDVKKISLFGLNIDKVNIGEALEFSFNSLKEKKQSVIVTPNLEILNACRKDSELCRLINSASLLLPDGIGVSLIAKILGKDKIKAVAGIDFGFSLLSLAYSYNKSVFLLGGKVGVAEKAGKSLKKHFPALNICGFCDGYSSLNKAVEKIEKSKPDIVLVCLGFPRQETWALENKAFLPDTSLLVCLGGSLDVWSGNLTRAPLLLRKAHLEWLWRVVNEPKRATRLIKSTSAIFSALYERAIENNFLDSLLVCFCCFFERPGRKLPVNNRKRL